MLVSGDAERVSSVEEESRLVVWVKFGNRLEFVCGRTVLRQ